MGFAGIALVAIVVLVGGLAAPQWSRRKEAVVESREGDRFSEGVRLVDTVGRQSPGLRSRPQPGGKPHTAALLGTSRPAESIEGAGMDHPKAPRRPRRVRKVEALGMTPEQARKLTKLKAARAARISRESAAARRRLVTAGVSLIAVLVVAGFAAAALLPWWVLAFPAVFLTGTLIASRLAGIRTEKAGALEEKRIRTLEAQIRGDQPAAAPSAPTEPDAAPESAGSEALFEKVTATLVKARDSWGQDAASSAATPKSAARKSSAPEAREETPKAEKTESRRSETDQPSEIAAVSAAEPSTSHELAARVGQEWEVANVPAPTHTRKPAVTGRQVHADTDIKGVPRVETAPGRPVATSTQAETVDTETAAQGAVKFDLDAILDARRAQ